MSIFKVSQNQNLPEKNFEQGNEDYVLSELRVLVEEYGSMAERYRSEGDAKMEWHMAGKAEGIEMAIMVIQRGK